MPVSVSFVVYENVSRIYKISPLGASLAHQQLDLHTKAAGQTHTRKGDHGNQADGVAWKKIHRYPRSDKS